MNFFNKEFRKISLENIDKSNMFWAWIGSFLGIIAISYFHMDILDDKDLTLVVGSFGASAVLIYGVPNSPLSQPRNLIGGHLLSAIVGVISYKLFSSNLFLATAIAVSTSILIMQLTLTLHPPGGATSLIAVIGGEQIHELEFFYILIPVFSGALILFLIAFIVNNIPKNRAYPESFKNYLKKKYQRYKRRSLKRDKR
ncbi:MULTISPECIES: HPP family protein [Aliarcobacter]|jgi:CBS-domain-containing membrane protein|uniref:HPP family protein n=4 Tax=Arcobacteraceae TaxID=2808963 RepID=A0AAU0P4I3_9BACT|nr:HPP family protein [Aliarcobacter cryaerophilus]NCB10870.1 HPP family protein [Erysipelotrichia bacterium]OQA75311.1 MAG: HPP family protein [Candidatus Dependentiae bacterium ADurb.Bin246]WNL16628.1 HPP family protein [Arcobacter sp. AZ-2023]WPD03741.1 HPP family protein [Arcobacter sp. DSM 115972]WPD12902.1 HPP family protein [Arcobacter sp. DSM 115960]